jgi:hypothetical protein
VHTTGTFFIKDPVHRNFPHLQEAGRVKFQLGMCYKGSGIRYFNKKR